jgi:hypothetical protein
MFRCCRSVKPRIGELGEGGSAASKEDFMMAAFVVRAVVFACQTHYERQDHIFSKGCGGHVRTMQRACLLSPRNERTHQQSINKLIKNLS